MSTLLFSTLKEKGDLYLASSLCDGLEDKDLKQVTTLLKNKEANPNVLMPLHGITPFHLVIGNDSETFAEEVTKLFLQYGGNPNVMSIDAMTPVHVAAAWGRAKILELLLANGGDPLCLDSDNCSPFHYAFQGEHYQAVSLLSKYCIDGKNDDEIPKFKFELDKVLINNSNIVAEYAVSDDQLFDSYCKQSSSPANNSQNSEISTSGYVPESDSADIISLNSDIFTGEKNHRKRIAEEEINYIKNSNKKENNFEFTKKTSVEDLHLINEIISHLSSSVTSEAYANNAVLKHYENKYSNGCKTNSPKRKQIAMTFNRSKKCCEYFELIDKQTTNKRHSVLQVIKQHNHFPCLKHKKILTNNSVKLSVVSNKDCISETPLKSLKTKVIQNKSNREIQFSNNVSKMNKDINVSKMNKWFNEPIISKSPNLVIEDYSHTKNKKSVKGQIQPKFTKKSSIIISSKIKNRNSNRHNIHSSVNQISRLKTDVTNTCSSKMIKKNKETSSKTQIPNKHKLDSSKPSTIIESSENYLNSTFSESKISISENNKRSHEIERRKKNLKTIVKNIDHCMYNNHKRNIFTENNLNTCISNKSKNTFNQYFSTFKHELTKSHSASELVFYSHPRFIKKQEKVVESRKEISNKESENFQNFDDPDEVSDSLVCIKGSVLSESSDSFLSLTEFDYIHNSNNKAESKEINDRSLLFSENNIISSKDDCSSCKNLDLETFFNVEEEYKYKDPEEGIVLLERRLCVSPSGTLSDKSTSFYSCSTTYSESLPKEMFILDNLSLREKLKNLGENPGPITNTTHHLYLKHLHKLESQSKRLIPQSLVSNIKSECSINFKKEKKKLNSTEWIKSLNDFEAIEQKVFLEFANPNPSRKWREGNSKNSFNYLLLDPRITKDLPRRADKLSLSEKWETFLSAIFYVGKGKQSRPYAHLYDAFKLWVSHNQQNDTSLKIQRIMDIWNEGKGVVVLHVFHNTIPVEAYTREAAMIEMLGTQKLGNCKYGDYYGVVSTWRIREKCELGRYLLFKALQILLVEGERQIFPDNL